VRASGSGDLFLGLDLGTSSLKALALDASGSILAVDSAGYPMYQPVSGAAEQDPRDWWVALASALARMWAHGIAPRRIAAIGLCGQMHGLVLLDARNEVLGRCQTWADIRCEPQTRGIARRLPAGRFAALTGSLPNASATAAKLLWVRRHEPDRWSAASHLLLPKDYLRLRLTGVLATDVTDASGTLLCNVAARDWSAEVLDTLHIPPALLPPVVESPTVVGRLLGEAAHALGLPAGIPVVVGAGDAECAAVGLGLVGEAADAGAALASIGTGAQLFVVTPEPLAVASAGLQTLCHAIPGRWHVMGALLAGASALDWLAAALAAPGASSVPVSTLLDEAAAVPAGAHGLLFLPYLRGTRMPAPDSSASGVFVGLRPGHTRAALARAVVEGVALGLAEASAAVRAAGVEIHTIRLAGGARRHPLWQTVLADAFALPVLSGAVEDASALGAALLAALGVDAVPSPSALAGLVARPAAVVAPDPSNVALYAARRAVARDTSRLMRPTFRALRSLP
jgi:xylulokinase